ncbi:MAG TPA: hypothetical protein VGJ43_18985, partial [Acidimicrobiales bacterium]
MVSTTRPATRARPHGPRFDATVAFLAASAYLAILAWGMANLSFDIWGGWWSARCWWRSAPRC